MTEQQAADLLTLTGQILDVAQQTQDLLSWLLLAVFLLSGLLIAGFVALLLLGGLK